MTDEKKSVPPVSDSERMHDEHDELNDHDAQNESIPGAKDDDAMRVLIKRSLRYDHLSSPNLLPSVQRKIRKRSRGRFYADGWSTASGRLSYILVAAIMLLILVVAYLAIAPSSFH